jgi:predicted esterase
MAAPGAQRADRDTAPGEAAVFFVHSTTFLGRDHWNAPLDDIDSRRRADLLVAATASAFNDAGPVWVPHYRQAALGAFLTHGPARDQAIDLAYADIRAAFSAFLAALPADQPIILAGHSQGALYVARLLRDRVRATPLARRLVAAYVIGWPVSARRGPRRWACPPAPPPIRPDALPGG